jgi:NTP pyrophosphatase (non-canonical NTP hydrolase)
MDFDSYQDKAALTDQASPETKDAQAALIVPLLGLAGEVGELLAAYKKRIRDGDAEALSQTRVEEELGDLLWYLSATASRMGLRLSDVARRNLAKCQARWAPTVPNTASSADEYDGTYPESEQLPRRMVFGFSSSTDGRQVLVTLDGKPFGDELTDLSSDPDGYRFHDIFHMSYAAVLGWSPVIRKLLKRKRRSNPEVDLIEDGGRGFAIDEGLSALIFAYAGGHGWMKGLRAVDNELLRTIKTMTSHLEVRSRTPWEWQHAILMGYDVWREVAKSGKGEVIVDLHKRTISLG